VTWDLRFPCTIIKNCLRDRVISLSLGHGGSKTSDLPDLAVLGVIRLISTFMFGGDMAELA
jgi:hypothetical protein